MHACGKRIPSSEHAVSVSLPKMGDVIGYEEREPAVLQQICSGYPRFVEHWMVRQVQDLLGPGVVALCDGAAVEHVLRRVGAFVPLTEEGVHAVRLPADADASVVACLRRFLQHSGLQLSSRAAEDFLIARGVLPAMQAETLADASKAPGLIQRVLADAYGAGVDQVHLYPSGMAGYYALFDAIGCLQGRRGKDTWLQVGWLYLDTGALLQRYADNTLIFGIDELARLECYLAENHKRVAALTTEVMTNPLLQTADIVRLSRLCRQYDIPFLIDTSMPTPFNVNVLEYADFVIESLTKFASGHADVMAGAIVSRADSAWASAVEGVLCPSQPYIRDLQRLAVHIEGYAARMQVINARTASLAAFLEGCPQVRTVYGAGQAGSRAAYEAVRCGSGSYGGVLSVVFTEPLEHVYDRLPLAKGPSFGTEFTLCMPYVYLAHYDLVSTEAGRVRLRQHGVDPGLLRISVGMEPEDEIQTAFTEAWAS
jgi:cystathionine gamma-synthase